MNAVGIAMAIGASTITHGIDVLRGWPARRAA